MVALVHRHGQLQQGPLLRRASAGHGVDSPPHGGMVEEVHEQDQREVVLGRAKGAA